MKPSISYLVWRASIALEHLMDAVDERQKFRERTKHVSEGTY